MPRAGDVGVGADPELARRGGGGRLPLTSPIRASLAGLLADLGWRAVEGEQGAGLDVGG